VHGRPPTDSAVYRRWIYNKAENLTASSSSIAYGTEFTHVIAESRDTLLAGQWEIVDVVYGFEGWKVHRDILSLVRERGLHGLWGVLEMRKAEKLWIFEKHGGRA
jgi:hypothetical protein